MYRKYRSKIPTAKENLHKMSTKRPKHLDNHFLWWYNKEKNS